MPYHPIPISISYQYPVLVGQGNPLSPMLFIIVMDHLHLDLAKASLNGDFIRVSYTLNMLMWRYINEERDDKSFMGVEKVSSP